MASPSVVHVLIPRTLQVSRQREIKIIDEIQVANQLTLRPGDESGLSR